MLRLDRLDRNLEGAPGLRDHANDFETVVADVDCFRLRITLGLHGDGQVRLVLVDQQARRLAALEREPIGVAFASLELPLD